MARDKAHRRAEQKIEEARRRGAKTLALSEMKLTELPESLGQLTQLEWLDLDHNELTLLPASFRNSEIQTLRLRDVPGLGIPLEISVKMDAKEILEYYFSTRGDQGSALRELKLVVVGRGGAGKTSLVKRLNRKALESTESETHGINISPLTLACYDGPVTARVWDFGGQHVLHAMHEFFLTARSLYLLVLGEREDMAERDAAYWLQLIRSYAGSAPVVVAVNKNEGRPREMDRESLQRNYGPILAWDKCWRDYEQDGGHYQDAHKPIRDGLRQAIDKVKSKRK